MEVHGVSRNRDQSTVLWFRYAFSTAS